jgi:hypothetical protein
MDGDLILIHVAIRGLDPCCILMKECGYFFYRLDGDLSSLQLLPNPHPATF